MLFISSTAHSYTFMDRWDAQDTFMQAAFVSITMIDWAQTWTMAGNNWRLGAENHHEMNPFLGRHPDRDKVTTMIALGIITHTIIAMALPDKVEFSGMEIPLRTIWQSFFIVVECSAVINNYGAGVRIEF